MDLIFATNNPNKVKEIQGLLPAAIRVMALKEAGIDIDIPEPHDSLAANATEKSSTIFRLTGKDCFSEDTGLEVDALNGAPGVKSARYAGEPVDPARNMELLLRELRGKSDRKARFRTVISLILAGKEYFFEGICTGSIIDAARGKEGFGYDPVFIPDGSNQSFGEMNMEEKKHFSHRAKATKQLVAFLQQQIGQ